MELGGHISTYAIVSSHFRDSNSEVDLLSVPTGHTRYWLTISFGHCSILRSLASRFALLYSEYILVFGQSWHIWVCLTNPTFVSWQFNNEMRRQRRSSLRIKSSNKPLNLSIKVVMQSTDVVREEIWVVGVLKADYLHPWQPAYAHNFSWWSFNVISFTFDESCLYVAQQVGLRILFYKKDSSKTEWTRVQGVEKCFPEQRSASWMDLWLNWRWRFPWSSRNVQLKTLPKFAQRVCCKFSTSFLPSNIHVKWQQQVRRASSVDVRFPT